MKDKVKDFILDLFFPKFCLFCRKEGKFLCDDCFGLFQISPIHRPLKGKYLDDLFYATEYNFFVKELIKKYKYPPLVKELASDLANLILVHFQLIEKTDFPNSLVVPVPLSKKKLRWRGFNQSEEIAKKIADFFNLPLIANCLIKTEETKNQVELSEIERKENLKGVFRVAQKEKILKKKIILIDDIFTTGTTMEECAKTLKEAGAEKVIGIVVARASPNQDFL